MGENTKYIATYTDISDWQINKYLQTGGTRAKCWVVNPRTGKLCFFKESHHNYSSEFWMEIIASKIGQSLNLNMLDYNIAKQNDLIGCLSDNMVEDDQELSELMKFLTGYDVTYNPDPKEKENQKRYTLSFIEKTLEFYNLEQHIESFIQVIVFDSLIGNQDRHQENWGFILPSFVALPIQRKNKKWLDKLIHWIVNQPTDNKDDKIVYNWSKANFSPIYDSGSCLGRENSEEKILQLLKDDIRLNAYINRCKAEIRLNGEKIGYFDLLKAMIKDEKYSKMTKEQIIKITKKYNKETILSIIQNIDNELPSECKENKLTEKRKEFVIKLLSLRLDKLCAIIK